MDSKAAEFQPGAAAKVYAYSVHFYTASGLIWALLAFLAIQRSDYRAAFLWFAVATMVDATDGFFARRWKVKMVLPYVDGRKMDDIIDYINYTFLPIMLILQAGWLPDPAWLWAAVPLIASVFGFCSDTAKEEGDGFFGGFPSYWNIFAFYVATWLHLWGQGLVLALVLFLSVLTVLPVRFVYPNLAPRWSWFFIWGGVAWLGILLLMLIDYPEVSGRLFYVSLIYPVLYGVLSVYLDRQARSRQHRA